MVLHSLVDEDKRAEEQPGFLALLQSILNVLPAYSWYSAPSGGLTFVNKRTAEYLGVPEDHPMRFGIEYGAQWDDWVPLLHPDDQEEARKYRLNSLRTGEAGEHSYRVRSAQGDYRWFLTRFEPLRASDGSLLLWVGVTLDIEGLKRTEQALRESEYKLRQIIETMPGFHWSTGPDGEPTHVNQRVLDYCGLQFSDFLQLGWEQFLHPDDFPETAKAFYDAIQTGTPYHAVHRLRRADGMYRWYHAAGEPLRDREGNIIEWYGLSVDIDENMRAQEALRESERSLRSAIDGIAGLVAVLAPNGELETVNRQCLEYFGRSLEELGNWQINDAVHPEDLPRILEIFKRAMASGIPFNYELRLRRFDGEYRWFDKPRRPNSR